MCASDEFHFLPRAEAASRHYDRIENFDREAMAESVAELKGFRRAFDLKAADEDNLENSVDLALLKANAAGMLIELETRQAWRHNPLMYLKVAFIGLDQALTKPASDAAERDERALARLGAIPRVLEQATYNLDGIPVTYYRASRAMTGDCGAYLKEVASCFSKNNETTTNSLKSALSALDVFETFLQELAPVPDDRLSPLSLEATLKDHFLSLRSLEEIFQLGVEEWDENQAHLDELGATIDSSRSWRELYHGYTPSDVETTSTYSLYEREIEQLSAFFEEIGFVGVDSPLSLQLCETPTYLRSVRSAASFSAALRADSGEKDLFYITNESSDQLGNEAAKLLKKRLHREYRFLSAHETIPGHHLLDCVRRGLDNPVRRQIESPLFYEGWAYYAESLLSEYGYANSPIESLVDSKRRLWRAARCQIDAGLTTGQLDREEAVELLTKTGFSPEEANLQIDRFKLNPGYQLCYSLGRYEIMGLREAYDGRMNRDQFHRLLLEGGELPFHLAKKRLDAWLEQHG
jgi:hypothetical protein